MRGSEGPRRDTARTRCAPHMHAHARVHSCVCMHAHTHAHARAHVHAHGMNERTRKRACARGKPRLDDFREAKASHAPSDLRAPTRVEMLLVMLRCCRLQFGLRARAVSAIMSQRRKYNVAELRVPPDPLPRRSAALTLLHFP